MKMLSLLPTAERLCLDEQFSQEPVYTRKSIGIPVPVGVFLVILGLMLLFFCIYPIVTLVLLGIAFILAGLSNIGQIRIKGLGKKKSNTVLNGLSIIGQKRDKGEPVRNTLWARIPTILAGIFIIVLGITCFFEKKMTKKAIYSSLLV